MRMANRMLVRFAAAALLCLIGPSMPASAQPEPAGNVAAAAARLGVDPQTVDDLVTANRILAHEGILDAYGHVSMRNPRNPSQFLIAQSRSPQFVTAEDIVAYDLDSNPVGAPPSHNLIERFIHGEIYKVRPDVRVIVHSHSPDVIPFSVSSVPLRPVFHMASFIAAGVPVWDAESSGDPAAPQILVRNNALGASLAAALGNKFAILQRGHGAVVVSANIRVAVKNAIYLNANARMQATAIALGGSVKYFSFEEGKAMGAAPGDLSRAWDYWRRRAYGEK